MFGTRTTTVTLILAALALFAGTPLAATAATQSQDPSPVAPPVDTPEERHALEAQSFCQDPDEFQRAEHGWIQLSSPIADELTLSEMLYFHVFEDVSNVGFVDPHTWTNGIDAYVIDIGCTTTSSSTDTTLCVRSQDPLGDGQNALSLPVPPGAPDRDYAVRYYEPDQLDLTGTTEDIECEHGLDRIPAGTHYIAVYLNEGPPRGVQLLEQGPAGIYSTYFCAKIGVTSGC